ncbi:MAG: DNA-protecting protein DprA [Candidatus Latescibacteria bacterium]|nr:DNA-protecting protein DprA [Candidatus Latescibacterota bacterium]NIM20993.1 DNA-protecting protein DprA [Candidatus Latescibacterota bacterium]NIM65128.1 DNA-protecting protein DprA [Candidatus Latescibacterota bacterium]NIO01643.1 DNA-protecting protein DprA [Candidatus Latescibacterota bacterium]NIO28160.1 DNA-protecting protein DprA [Candidatus Latescibacterota bacterium]
MFRSYYPFLALLLSKGAGPGACRKLWECAGASLEGAFYKLKSPRGRREISILLGTAIGSTRWGEFERQIEKIESSGAGVVCFSDAAYPRYLRDIQDPPPILFYGGDLKSLDKRGVAIVGTRKPSPRGTAFARNLARDLSQLGIMVVSGLARGIDAAAHEGSLEGDGPAVGIIGTGLDVCYPAENRWLMNQIASRGCIVTEQLMRMIPQSHVFPLRNRLISAVSKIVVVVEAGQKSGARITARWALEQGREVGAVPGFPGDFRSRGVNSLLKSGAVLVESAEDILQAVPLLRENITAEDHRMGAAPAKVRNGMAKNDGAPESTRPEISEVLTALSSHPIDPDTLAAHLGKDVALIQSILFELEMNGEVGRDLAGCYFKR